MATIENHAENARFPFQMASAQPHCAVTGLDFRRQSQGLKQTIELARTACVIRKESCVRVLTSGIIIQLSISVPLDIYLGISYRSGTKMMARVTAANMRLASRTANYGPSKETRMTLRVTDDPSLRP